MRIALTTLLLAGATLLGGGVQERECYDLQVGDWTLDGREVPLSSGLPPRIQLGSPQVISDRRGRRTVRELGVPAGGWASRMPPTSWVERGEAIEFGWSNGFEAFHALVRLDEEEFRGTIRHQTDYSRDQATAPIRGVRVACFPLEVQAPTRAPSAFAVRFENDQVLRLGDSLPPMFQGILGNMVVEKPPLAGAMAGADSLRFWARGVVGDLRIFYPPERLEDVRQALEEELGAPTGSTGNVWNSYWYQIVVDRQDRGGGLTTTVFGFGRLNRGLPN